MKNLVTQHAIKAAKFQPAATPLTTMHAVQHALKQPSLLLGAQQRRTAQLPLFALELLTALHPASSSPSSTVPTPSTVVRCDLMPNKVRDAKGMRTNWSDPRPDSTVCAAKRMETKRMMFPTLKSSQPTAA